MFIRTSLTNANSTRSVIPLEENLTNDNACDCPVAEAMFVGSRGGGDIVLALLCFWASLLQQKPAMGRIILWLPPLHLSHPFGDCRGCWACMSSQTLLQGETSQSWTGLINSICHSSAPGSCRMHRCISAGKGAMGWYLLDSGCILIAGRHDPS